MGENWGAIEHEIAREFKEYGIDAVIVHQSHGEYNVATGKKEKTFTRYQTYVLFSNVTIQELSFIGANEISLRVSPPDGFDIKNNKNLLLETNQYIFTIKTIKPVMPGGVVLYYKIIAEVYDGD